jgi:hypothetical protein
VEYCPVNPPPPILLPPVDASLWCVRVALRGAPSVGGSLAGGVGGLAREILVGPVLAGAGGGGGPLNACIGALVGGRFAFRDGAAASYGPELKFHQQVFINSMLVILTDATLQYTETNK